jgi:hypothetical protein
LRWKGEKEKKIWQSNNLPKNNGNKEGILERRKIREVF